MKPSEQQTEAYQHLFDYYNHEMFKDELEHVFLNFSRKNRSHGFFAPQRWDHPTQGDNKSIHEISLNPETLVREPKEYISTLVHEMVHLWQQDFGTPGRRGYHNLQWAKKMNEIGLKPISYDQPGKEIGQSVSHEIITGGPYDLAYEKMPQNYIFPYRCNEGVMFNGVQFFVEDDEEPEIEYVGNIVINHTQIELKRDNPSGMKFTYACPDCTNKIWGKDHLNIVCGDCHQAFIMIS